jgi:MSHA biogenesis protein MshN
MLKDLEERTPEQGQVAMPVAVSNKPSTMKIVLISLVVLISLNLLGLYIWNLQERVTSSELKVKQQSQASVVNTSRELSKQPVEILKPTLKALDQEAIVQQTPHQEEPIPQKISLEEPKADSAIALPQQPIVKEQASSSKLVSKRVVAPIPLAKSESVKSKSVKPKSAQQESTTAEPINARFDDNELVTPRTVKIATASKMKVSRRQMTPKELVVQKLARAEKAIKSNDIIKAEALFEEVLIINPNDKQARKKLAALWFGRKSYQQATNLLSQGIALDRSDAELRLLKARIHQQQGQYDAAYNTLKPLALLKKQEYQVMLANISQRIEQHKSAIQAYKILIEMQAYSGRWHLGLAIVYDKNSQFSLAVTEYRLSLTKSDLSIASAEFAQQRIQALGE